MTKHVVNWVWLADSLDMACDIRGMSYRDVALAVGISPSGLTRLRQGKHLEADAVAALTAWMFPTRIPHWVREA